MKYIIASDIFGITDELVAFAAQLTQLKDLDIISPYESGEIAFKDERKAYQYFKEYIGLEGYTNKLSDHIQRSLEPVSILGFSVGASATWRINKNIDARKIMGALGLYSSQIRHYLSKPPNFPTTLVFPEQETCFDVEIAMFKLSKYQHVTCYQMPYGHGFMNYHSRHFNQDAFNLITRSLTNLPNGKPFNQVCF